MTQVIVIDGSKWKTVLDFMTALRWAIGAPDWHGSSIDAFIDSMIIGQINSVEPPYSVRIVGSEHAPEEVQDYIRLMISELMDARAYSARSGSGDVDVTLVIEEPRQASESD